MRLGRSGRPNDNVLCLIFFSGSESPPQVAPTSTFKVTNFGTQTDIGYKEMHKFQSFLSEENKTCPKTPVCTFLNSSQEKSRRWTGLDKYDLNTIWLHLGDVKHRLNLLNMDTTSG